MAAQIKKECAEVSADVGNGDGFLPARGAVNCSWPWKGSHEVYVNVKETSSWQAFAQMRQSFCMPGHMKRWATSLAVALVAEWQIVGTLDHFEG
jgi:hypothetical protein